MVTLIVKDPCRPSVKNAVQLCINAGVKSLPQIFLSLLDSEFPAEDHSDVRMVTGDNLRTAKAIALECGILGSDADAIEPNLIEGKAFCAYSEAQRPDIAEKISVMGRSSPNDKCASIKEEGTCCCCNWRWH